MHNSINPGCPVAMATRSSVVALSTFSLPAFGFMKIPADSHKTAHLRQQTM